MLLGPIVPDRMDAHDVAVAGQLHRAGYQAHFHRPTAPAVANPIVCARKLHVSGGVHNPGHGQPVGGPPRPAAALLQPDLLLVGGVGFAALHVFGDQHLTVKDSHQMIGGYRLDRFTGWRQWAAPTFVVDSSGPVEAGVDGEALLLDPPLGAVAPRRWL